MSAEQLPIPFVPEHKRWLRQFAITRGTPVQAGWERELTIGTFSLFTYPGAKTVDIVDASGVRIGAFVGTLIDADRGYVVEGPLTFHAPQGAGGLDAAIEAFAYKYGGSWLLAIAACGAERVYLDCDGTQSLVFDPSLGSAGATTGMLLDDTAYKARFDGALFNALGVMGEGWFPSGLTAHVGVRRLLCNHYLDLQTWRTQRHWPRADFAQVRTLDAAHRVADIVRGATSALIAHGRPDGGNRVSAALTGGNETRFLLAANRELRNDLDFFTVSAPATQCDVYLAEQLASIGGLSHQLLPAREASAQDQAAWLYRASHCITGPNKASHPSIAPLANYDSFIGGLGGEIGRAFFWRSSDTAQTKIDADSLLPRFGMPFNEQVHEETRVWLDGVAGMDALAVLDLAYLELRMSAWAFAQEYSDSTVPHFHPMVCREVYQLMLQLSPDAKRGNSLILEGVASLWPEIATLPINRYGDYRDTLKTLSRLSQPHLVVKKLRKVLG